MNSPQSPQLIPLCSDLMGRSVKTAAVTAGLRGHSDSQVTNEEHQNSSDSHDTNKQHHYHHASSQDDYARLLAHGSSGVTEVPPRNEWKWKGRMEKQFLDSRANQNSGDGCYGQLWLPRFAVLTEDRLTFIHDENSEHVTDVIPLAELIRIDFTDLQDAMGIPRQQQDSKTRIFEQQDSSRDPPQGQESSHSAYKQLTLKTMKGGFNSGRKCTYRLPAKDAEVWAIELQMRSALAKNKADNAALTAAHGYHTFSYYRAKALALYEADISQYWLAAMILFAFAIDVWDAQLLPEEGSVEIPHVQNCVMW
jgi:hypothetical protein